MSKLLKYCLQRNWIAVVFVVFSAPNLASTFSCSSAELIGDAEDQETSLFWAKSYAGDSLEFGLQGLLNYNGGYNIIGYTESFGEGGDIWVVSLDSFGNINWQKVYGNIKFDYTFSSNSTSNNELLIAGNSEGESMGLYYHFWILKLDERGDIVWYKEYDSIDTHDINVRAIHQDSEKGIIIATNLGIALLDEQGNIVWNNNCNDNLNIQYEYLQWTLDGGIIAGGKIFVSDIEQEDVFLIKLDQYGNIQWNRYLGGVGRDVSYSLYQDNGGNYILAGETNSFDTSESDFWIIKLNDEGEIIWQKAFGSIQNDSALGIHLGIDNSYVIAGVTGVTDVFESGNYDAMILNIDSEGNILWQKTYGGSGYDSANSIRMIGNDGYIIAGTTDSFGTSSGDLWVIKMDTSGVIANSCPLGIGMGASLSASITSAVPMEKSIYVTSEIINQRDGEIISSDTSAFIETQCRR